MLFKRIELIKSTSEHIYTAFYTIQWRSPHRMHIIDYADANLRQWAHCNIIYSINAINGVVWNALHHLPWDMIVDAGIAGAAPRCQCVHHQQRRRRPRRSNNHQMALQVLRSHGWNGYWRVMEGIWTIKRPFHVSSQEMCSFILQTSGFTLCGRQSTLEIYTNWRAARLRAEMHLIN